MTIDLRDEFAATTFEEMRDGIVAALRGVDWKTELTLGLVITDIIEMMAEATTASEFDQLWTSIVGYADSEGIDILR